MARPHTRQMLFVSCTLLHVHMCLCSSEDLGLLCRSIARLLEYLLDDSASPLAPEVRGALSRDRIPVPTVQGSLLPSSSCVYSPPSAGLGPLGRLDGQAIVLVHPAVPMRVCTAMGIPALADVVEERLDASVALQPVAMIQGIAAIDVAARMRDERFADAAHALLSLARQGGGGAAAALVTAEDVATALRGAADRLQFVEECRTSLVFQRGPRAIPLEASSKKVGRWGRGAGLGANRRALQTNPYMPYICTTGLFTILHSSIKAPPSHAHTTPYGFTAGPHLCGHQDWLHHRLLHSSRCTPQRCPQRSYQQAALQREHPPSGPAP